MIESLLVGDDIFFHSDLRAVNDERLQNSERLTDMDHMRALIIVGRSHEMTKERVQSVLSNRSADVTPFKIECILPVVRCVCSPYILARCKEAKLYEFPIPLYLLPKTNGMCALHPNYYKHIFTSSLF